MKHFLALLLFLPLAANAQSGAPAPCQQDSYRQFDFWIGEWTVTQNGQPAGSNIIKAVDKGCALSENWTSAAGNFTGRSLNTYNSNAGNWHQTWVDSGGTLLQLNGGLVEGSMVLASTITVKDGSTFTNRISWTPHDDGTVRQLWETSNDDGATWNTAFDGLYQRSKP